jgi:hypothetical protein
MARWKEKYKLEFASEFGIDKGELDMDIYLVGLKEYQKKLADRNKNVAAIKKREKIVVKIVPKRDKD